ncbi:hypothetical protein [Lentzea nigeriaca]|uniref:hypothetical protein n=1 Tax=Lentzea nigeriaca TaxID=1128665 RepID=UPI0019579183|nr:hypothetical protein [Lentzea nigeriaca]MBM7864267.1 hypothetical protein [Lentzea nigeriaca]
MRYHVVLTAHAHYPEAGPRAVMRIDGDHEEIFNPARGWTVADRRYREWFVNTRISETEAESITARIGPLPSLDDENWDPRNTSERALAIEGYGDPYLHFAVEAEGHPFDYPLTAVHEQLAGERLRLSYTKDLSWKVVPVEGRLVRITGEDSKRFEQVQARRVFGDAEIRHFAVVNHLRPDPRDPYLLLREFADVVDRYGLHLYELYDENRQWVRVGHQSRLGMPVLEHLLTSLDASSRRGARGVLRLPRRRRESVARGARPGGEVRLHHRKNVRDLLA